MRSFQILSALAAVLPLASAYPVFSTPAAGASLASTEVTITWTDTGSPGITNMGAFVIDLYGGSNTGATKLQASVASGAASAMSATATIDDTVGGSTIENAYYLKMTTQVTGGGEIITFSPRFSITGMTGTWPTTFTVTETSASAEISTAGTLSGVTISSSSSSTGSYHETGSYAITYTLQTGGTRYAPMPLRPGTTITATHTNPQYPTSSVSIATTYLGTPNVIFTQTDSINYSAASHPNTNAAASQPTGDSAKYLARWKD